MKLIVPSLAAATPSIRTTTTTESPINAMSLLSHYSIHHDSHVSQSSSKKPNPARRARRIFGSGTHRKAVLELVTLAGPVLVEASQMTQGIPYVECLAKVIAYIVRANSEMETVATTFSVLGERVIRLQGIILDVYEDMKKQEVCPEDFRKPLRLLEECEQDVSSAIEEFNTLLNIRQAIATEQIKRSLSEVKSMTIS
ncbi:uncharacterized protein STEHIDRAFT_113347 [Stereum hirsutum FP-91666 SS1]|uniref:uncharacterized protein n=1 Tax=Stereum hirsutum (strain FP-91666) TaxID=721885 RepID=UPI000444A10F|nr:uncharacterized protein STEHIDRAFT_113347 [Stereum hirsutum FP-91666 SS1]EIM84170.1 hypothetical protein STEHIDRAFT_113347 [Stereum hirsutum FP-91666 SS1]